MTEMVVVVARCGECPMRAHAESRAAPWIVVDPWRRNRHRNARGFVIPPATERDGPALLLLLLLPPPLPPPLLLLLLLLLLAVIPRLRFLKQLAYLAIFRVFSTAA